MEYLMLVVLLAGLLFAASWFVTRSTSPLAKSRLLRWLLIWPVILEKDAKLSQGNPRTNVVLILGIVLIVIAIVAILITPPKGG